MPLFKDLPTLFLTESFLKVDLLDKLADFPCVLLTQLFKFERLHRAETLFPHLFGLVHHELVHIALYTYAPGACSMPFLRCLTCGSYVGIVVGADAGHHGDFVQFRYKIRLIVLRVVLGA